MREWCARCTEKVRLTQMRRECGLAAVGSELEACVVDVVVVRMPMRLPSGPSGEPPMVHVTSESCEAPW